ncbi:hypothetical protein GCM10010313_19110 [Streptomyces violarus]|nr:hypothetical protein GCM10010313_19110 [Streptomyces violarus]
MAVAVAVAVRATAATAARARRAGRAAKRERIEISIVQKWVVSAGCWDDRSLFRDPSRPPQVAVMMGRRNAGTVADQQRR